MKIERIVRHYCIEAAKIFKVENPAKFTKSGKLSRSERAKKLRTVYSRKWCLAHNHFCRAYNLALRKGKDMSNDIVARNVYDHI